MILVFGRTGQVASELCRLKNVYALGRETVDLTDSASCSDAIFQFAPKAVINAAAYTAVDKAEEEEALATIVNGAAPTSMAEACAEIKIPFVHISTDYVFDGTGQKAWKPESTPNPINAYGRSKLIGEKGIRDSNAIYAILRTSWVVSPHGTNFVKTILGLSNAQEEVSVVSDQIGGLTPAASIALACIEIAEQLQVEPAKSGAYHFSGAPDVSWAEISNEIFRQIERDVSIRSIASADYPTKAMRPLNSRLDCGETEKVFGVRRPDWRQGLNDILNDLGALQ